ncbi:MAG: zinc ribbon domain-containing protein [Candidatus Thorarchaeota archaeon]
MGMARSKGVTISVKVPINLDGMTKRTRQRLRQIVGRDSRAIRSFLGIIEQHEHELLTSRNKNRIHDGKLDKLTMTAIKVKAGYAQRLTVPHDFKVRFSRMSRNELTECRQTDVFMYERYLELRRQKGRRASRPCVANSTRRIPRWIFNQRFKISEHHTSGASWWLDLRDSLDSVPAGQRVHDRLLIPLKISPFHLNQMKRGEVKALQIFTDKYRKWWVTFAVRVDTPEQEIDYLPPAILGIDLSIEKAACTTLVTPTKVRETRYFVQRSKVQQIRELDRRVADIQHNMDTRRNNRQSYDKLTLELRALRGKRERVAREYDRNLVKLLTGYISNLSEKYTLHVAIGRLKNIRRAARKGSNRGHRFRGMIHRWAFARITEALKHQLAQLGWTVEGKDSKFRTVPENWTSILCWKCGNKGSRPRQNYFVCSTCGHKSNADRNGAINIAGRLITLTKSLHGVRGLGKWADSVQRAAKRSRPKARERTRSSRRRSLLPSKGQVSDLGESAAAHHVQTDLLSFGDEPGMGDEDPAVERDAETLSVAGNGTSRVRQEKEARTEGGMPSR